MSLSQKKNENFREECEVVKKIPPSKRHDFCVLRCVKRLTSEIRKKIKKLWTQRDSKAHRKLKSLRSVEQNVTTRKKELITRWKMSKHKIGQRMLIGFWAFMRPWRTSAVARKIAQMITVAKGDTITQLFTRESDEAWNHKENLPEKLSISISILKWCSIFCKTAFKWNATRSFFYWKEIDINWLH